jgi:hypothetical protein
MPLEEQSVKPTRVPTISRVVGDTIIELVYDPAKRETGLVVSRGGGLWNVEKEVDVGGETLIPYAASNNLIAHECVLFAAKPEHHGDKSQLLADIEAYLNRYVDLSPAFAKIAAHYVLLSWIHDAIDEIPYLRLQGDYGTGKTRGLLAIGLICYKPFFASGASTVSPIFHILDAFGGTLVLDEADFRFSDATNDLVKILNNGTMKGLPVLRTMQNRHRELNPRAFRVFGPKIVAMRGSYQDEALESRFFSENMNVRRLRADIPLHVPPTLRTEALALRNKLLHFRLCTLFDVRINPKLAARELEPRFNQIALPLLSVIDDAELRTSVLQHLVRQSETSARSRNRQVVVTIIALLQDAFADENKASVPIREIVDKLNANLGTDRTYTTKQVARIIRHQLGDVIHKSDGIHVIARSEMAAVKEAAQSARRDTHSAVPQEAAPVA